MACQKTVSWTYFFIFSYICIYNRKILSLACLLRTRARTCGRRRWSFYYFHILNILHTHIFHHQRIFRLLSYWIRVAIFTPSSSSSLLLPIQNPLFISHTMEAINAATTPGHPHDRVLNACDPVYKTIKRQHTFIT